MSPNESGFSIGEVAAKTGLGESTLRMWETRYGFPRPERLPSGRRVYSSRDLEQLESVLKHRSEGLSLQAAVERVRLAGERPPASVSRMLRDRFPHLHPRTMTKEALLWVTRAVEDEIAARALNPLLIGSFQEERFYRQSQDRWEQLARFAHQAIVLADFPWVRSENRSPAEVPLVPNDPLFQEWVVVCHDEELSVCVAGRERPESRPTRRFEVVWTIEPAVAQEAARICLNLTTRNASELTEDLLPLVSGRPRPVEGFDVQVALDLATRVSSYATDGRGA